MACPVKVLCVGTEDTTLSTRIAVLQQAHFDAIGCTPERMPEVMADETFDIVLLSAGVVETEVTELRDKSRGPVVISLEALTFPAELLERIEGVEAFHSCGEEASKGAKSTFPVR